MRTFAAIISVLLMSCGTGTGSKAGSTTDSGPAPAANQADDATQHSRDKNRRQVITLSEALLNDKGTDTVNYGRVRTGEILSRPMQIRNAGDKPIVITGLVKTCGCLDMEYPRAPIKAGETVDVTLVFDTRGITGWVYKTIQISTSLGTKAYTLVILAEAR